MDTVVRFRLGYVLYRKFGAQFVQVFQIGREGELSRFAHVSCAKDGGLDLDEMRDTECYVCGRQFFCHEEPEEGCILAELGDLEDGEFAASGRGAVHWACAAEAWTPELFGGVCGGA